MAANIVSVANVAGKNDIVFGAVKTIGFPIASCLIQQIPSRTIGSTACVTKITVIPTGDQYFTSTVASSIYTSSAYTGSAKVSFTSTIAGVNENALSSTAVTGFPSTGVLLETLTTSRVYGATTCVTKVTMLATGTEYFTADTVATLAGLTA
jgi:hypothetical protein